MIVPVVWEAGKGTDLCLSVIRSLCSLWLTSALALCKFLWLGAVNLTVWSSLEVTDVALLSAVCPVFSAGCPPASYSDLSRKCTHSWITDRETWAYQERTCNPKLHCGAGFLCHRAHSECSFPVFSWMAPVLKSPAYLSTWSLKY